MTPGRSFTITRTTGGVCARPRCEEPPVTLVRGDTGQEVRVCEQHWPGIIAAAYQLAGVARRTVPRQGECIHE